MKIHPVPFKALGGLCEQDDVDAAMRVISNATEPEGTFFPLPEETDFQDAFAEHEGAKHAVAVNSCGTGLDVCMMVLGIQAGDEVITTPLTFVCSATCAAARGAKVVFADIDQETMNLDPEKVRAKISDRTRAIVPVHYTGLPCDLDAFDQISGETGIPIIYDAAHMAGGLYQGKPVGGRGQASCYSFQSNKNMTTLGEGGAVTTDDPEFAEKVRQKKTFGYVYGGPQLRVVTIGFNYRMTKVQYAVGLTQVAKLGRVVSERRERMLRINELLAGVEELILPVGHGPGHASHMYSVRLDTDKAGFSEADLREHMQDAYQVGSAKCYAVVWSWEAFAEIDYDNSDCPIAEKACEQVFQLPIFPDTPFEDLDYIVWTLKESIAELQRS